MIGGDLKWDMEDWYIEAPIGIWLMTAFGYTKVGGYTELLNLLLFESLFLNLATFF